MVRFPRRLCMALAALSLALGVGAAQTIFELPDASIAEIRENYHPTSVDLPPDIGDAAQYHLVRSILPSLIPADPSTESPGTDFERFLDRVVEDLDVARAGGGICANDLDGQSYRFAGGGYRIAGGEYRIAGGGGIMASPVDLSDPNGDGTAGPFWTLEPSPLMVDVAAAQPFTLVLLDNFDFDLLPGSMEGFAQGGIDHAASKHGHLVLYHSLLLMGAVAPTAPISLQVNEETGYRSQQPIRWAEIAVPLRTSNTAYVKLVDVDFDRGLRHVMDAVAFANDTFSGEPNVAFNASWNLVPCDLASAYDEATGAREHLAYESFAHFLWSAIVNDLDDPEFDTYFLEYVQRTGVTGDDQEFELERDKWAFRATLAAAEWASQEVATLAHSPDSWFASAGNLGLEFALPPASFANVTSVGACEMTRIGRATTLRPEAASWSNRGEANVLGAWFRGTLGGAVPYAPYAGSSYASPLAAIAFATHRSDTLLTCDP